MPKTVEILNNVRIFKQQGLVERACQLLLEARENEPRHPEVHAVLVNTLLEMNNFPAAVEALREAVANLEAIPVDNYLVIAEYLLKQQQPAHAATVLELARTQEPAEHRVLQMLLQVYQTLGDSAAQQPVCKKLIESDLHREFSCLAPDFAQLPQNARLAYIGHLNYARIYAGIISKIRPDVQNVFALDLNPNSPYFNNPRYESEYKIIAEDLFAEDSAQVDAFVSVGMDMVHALNMAAGLFKKNLLNCEDPRPFFLIPGFLDGQNEFVQLPPAAILDKLNMAVLDFYASANELYFPGHKLNINNLITFYQNHYQELLRSMLRKCLNKMRQSGALLVCFTGKAPQVKDFEERVARCRQLWSARDQGHIRRLWGELPEFSEEYVSDITTYPVPVAKRDGVVLKDVSSAYVNIKNGYRVTVGAPDKPENSIYLLGTCWAYGPGSEDRHTVQSYLQEFIKDHEDFPGDYAVRSRGIPGCTEYEVLYKLHELPLQAGDIVVTSWLHLSGAGPEEETSAMLQEEFHNFICVDMANMPALEPEDFCWDGHSNYRYYQMHAKFIFDALIQAKKTPFADAHDTPATILEESQERLVDGCFSAMRKGYEATDEQMFKWLKELEKLKLQPGTTGSIVMNCNPFTRGHLYLIEYAAARVDNLIIFVVEEDRSFFKFADRIELVRAGSAHLSNVTVIPSGQFIISALTFPDYFNKEAPEAFTIDAANDLETFGRHIAPVLNITIRFVGEEPNCRVTRQYNQQMHAILEDFFVHVVEIPRKEESGRPISATLVRNFIIYFYIYHNLLAQSADRDMQARFRDLLLDGDFKELSTMVAREEYEALKKQLKQVVPQLPCPPDQSLACGLQQKLEELVPSTTVHFLGEKYFGGPK